MAANSQLVPHYSKDADTVITHYGIISNTEHHTQMDMISGNLQLSGMYTSLLGIYGELGLLHPINGEQIFAHGSLAITPHRINPFLGIGGYYTAQNGSIAELGLGLTHLRYDLASLSTGALFNGYTALLEEGLNANNLDIKFKLTFPFTERLHSFIGLSYGFNFFGSNLPIAENIPHTERSALVEPPLTENAYLGNYYGNQAHFHLNQLSIGTKLIISDFSD